MIYKAKNIKRCEVELAMAKGTVSTSFHKLTTRNIKKITCTFACYESPSSVKRVKQPNIIRKKTWKLAWQNEKRKDFI